MKEYEVIMWRPDGQENVGAFEIPTKEKVTLQPLGSTCRILADRRTIGGGTITERSKEDLVSPQQLRIVYEGSFRERCGRFVLVCLASEAEIAAELCEGEVVFAD